MHGWSVSGAHILGKLHVGFRILLELNKYLLGQLGKKSSEKQNLPN